MNFYVKSFFAYAILFTLFFTGCKGKPEDSIEKLAEKAAIYENIKQYPNAIDLYDKILKKDPFYLDAYLRKGKSHQALGNIDEAMAVYKKGFVLDETHLPLTRALAEVFFLKGELENSLSYCNKVREIEPTDPFTLNLIGKVHAAKGELEESATWLKRASDNDPANPSYLLDLVRVLNSRENIQEALAVCNSFLEREGTEKSMDVSTMKADLLMRLNRYEDALGYLNQLNESAPEDPEVLSRIARYYFVNENEPEAMKFLRAALEIEPNHLQSQLLRGSILLRQGNGADALVIFQTLARNFPNWPDVQLKLGASYQLLGQWEQAKTAYQRLIQIVPEFYPAQIALANIYFRDGWYEEVEKICLSIIDKEPENTDALKILAANYLTQRKYQQAIPVYKKIIALTPEMTKSHAFLAELHLSSSDFQTAYIESQKALEETPGDKRMKLVSGLALKFLGMVPQAQEIFQSLLEEDPDYAPARYQLGEVYSSQNLWDAAEEQYQKILDKNPDNMDVMLRIGTVYWRQEKYEKAEEYFLDLVTKYPEDIRLYYELGRLYAQQKKLSEAIEKFETVVNKKPKHLLGNLLLANLYRQQGELKKAEDVLKRLIEIRPGLNLENELALLLIAQNKENEALRFIRSLPVVKQKQDRIQFTKGICLLLLDEGEDAVITFRRLSEKSPGFLAYNLCYADSYVALDSLSKASSLFEEKYASFPEMGGWYRTYLADLKESKTQRPMVLANIHRFLLFSYFQWGLQFEDEFDELSEPFRNNPLILMVKANGFLRSEKMEQAREIYDNLTAKYSKSAYAHYRQGLFFLKNEENASAIQAFVTAMRANPGAVIVRIPLIQLLIRNNRSREAEQIALDSINKYPEEKDIYFLLADLYTDQKRYEEGLDLMKKIYEENPEELRAALKMGQLYFNLHQYDESADILKPFVLRYPKNIVGNSLYLRALLASNRQEEAQEAIRNIEQNIPQLNVTMPQIMLYLNKGSYKEAGGLVHTIDSTAFSSAPNLFVLGLVFQANHDYKQAKKYFLMGSEKTNDKLLFFLAYLNLLKKDASEEEFNKQVEELIKESKGSKDYSEMLEKIMATERYPEAALFSLNHLFLSVLNSWDVRAYEGFQEWLEKYPKNLFFYRIQFYLSERNRWPEKRIKSLEDLLVYYPNDEFALMQLGRIRLGMQQREKAAELFKKVLSLNSNNEEALTFLGMISSDQENFEKAREYYDLALAINPENVIVLNNLAYLYSNESPLDLERALQHAEKAIKIAPTNGPIADTLGWIYYKQGRYAEALVQLERARQIIPQFPEVYYHLGKTSLALKDSGKAKAAFEKALELNPEAGYAEEVKELLKKM